MDSLVSTQWLADHLGEADLRILDATWFLPGEPRDAVAEFDVGITKTGSRRRQPART